MFLLAAKPVTRPNDKSLGIFGTQRQAADALSLVKEGGP
jgi:hypothetical protein